MQIEPVNHADWAQVKDLLGGVHMTSTLPLVMARTGTMENSYPALAGENVLLEAKEGDQIVGVLRGLLHQRMIEGRPQRLIYIGDLRVHPQWRGKGVSIRMGQVLAETVTKAGITHGYFLVNEGNVALRKVVEKSMNLSTYELTTHKTASLLMVKKPNSVSTDFVRVEPSLTMFKDFIDSLSGYLLAPAWNAEDFLKFYKNYPEIRFYAGTKQPQRLAFALWDQSGFRHLFSGRYTFGMEVISRSWNLISKFSQAPPFPKVGKPWKQVEVCFVNPTLIQGLDVDTFIRGEVWSMGAHFANRIYDGLNQPVVPPTGFRYSSTAHLIGFSVNEAPPLKVNLQSPVYVDLALI